MNSGHGGGELLSIALAGTFTLAGVERTLRWLSEQIGRHGEVRTAPHGQLLEPLKDPEGLLRTHTGVNLLLIRPEDMLRRADSPAPSDAVHDVTPGAEAAAEETVAALISAASASAARMWLVAVTPPSPHAAARPAVARWIAEITRRVESAVRQAAGMRLLDLAEARRIYAVTEVHDEHGDALAHLPYTEEYLAATAMAAIRAAVTIDRPPVKVIVLDCDNTLWSGRCGEDGPSGVDVSAPYLRLQRFMLAQRANGRLLCLCSRNEEADVRAVFAARPEMPLTFDAVTAWRFGWGPKPSALRELSAELGLALDSMVFVDDDPVECAAVRDQLPAVTVVELPADAEEIPDLLEHEWVFDQLTTTEEDRLRAESYTAEAGRRDLSARSESYADFLERCRIEVAFPPLDESALERAAQLTSRTTQFTLSGVVYSVSELRAHLADGGEAWTIRVRDRFGDYGTVGLIVASRRDGGLFLHALLLSCRVLNRGVDRQVRAFLADLVRSRGIPSLHLAFRATGRNAPARAFVAAMVDVPASSADGRPRELVVPADRLDDAEPGGGAHAAR
ncbi:FkbH-like protein [Actinoalloteichus hoggarensis]|uniref:Uncharacterized protein n=1 Tax=Actinoalloteichus hoggarensis TaxID=1470176 RepID=A0A221W4W1_9PSEU|nr:HAD-IIIC family phosphatase [Actinoalloteichus hoggarensis]ASO20691.1 hypothetical protein AHOG_15325 [Actinoalloteichus hoggarensis]MBB5924456.1 FkbH-like protein [Actinoalloteichus hoggarensis]